MAGKKGGKQAGKQGPPVSSGAASKGAGAPEDKLRGLSGGGTRGKAPASSSGPAGSAGGAQKDTLVTWTEGVRPWWVVSVLEKTQPDWLGIDVECDSRFSEWERWSRCLEEAEPTLALVFKHLASSDDEDTEIDMFRALLKVLTPGRMPKVNEGVAYSDCLDIWTRKGGDKVLEDAKGIHHRYQGANSMLMASPLAIWPPPLELVTPRGDGAEGASDCWEVRFNRTPLGEELMGIAMGTMTEKDWKGVTWFRKADALGRPTETWFLKALNVDVSSRRNETFKWGPNDNMLVGNAVWAPQCAICLERPGGAGNHEHTQCPLVGTLNKIRQQGELKPLRFLGRTLFREDEKVDLDMPTEMRAMKVTIARLEERLDKLEKAHAASAAPPHSSGQGKKRKPEDGGNSGAPPAKKGKGGGGQGGQGKPASRAQQGGKGKGKGSAGGSGGATSWE
ncbi:hypothetical protein EV363DRAFT_1462231 [Boletus edulis]|nr:hypothetical protein EV363DRAFT_1462231 [Boletus edulis]